MNLDLPINIARIPPETAVTACTIPIAVKKMLGIKLSLNKVIAVTKRIIVFNKEERRRGEVKEERKGGKRRRRYLIHIYEETRMDEISYAVFCLKKKKKTY